ncbi:rhodanese-like domain-containing protein [Pollutibacter soli]|uniref:rhodanese-like domain-containing protein n=1 Tax=Pollutibacter soli TaxID=3034157 RepID=UPI003013F1E7
MKTFFSICFLVVFSVAAKAQAVKVVGVKEFAEGVQKKNVQIVDVRTPEEYQEGIIRGAKLADWNNQAQFQEAAKKLDKTKPVYVYCLAGVRSGKAAEWMIKNGFTEVYSLEGGIKEWKAKEMPVVKN